MKYLVLAVVVLVAVWWLRAKVSRSESHETNHADRDRASARKQADRAIEAMVACAHCGVHVAASEAVQGHQGLYCGEAHRALAEPR